MHIKKIPLIVLKLISRSIRKTIERFANFFTYVASAGKNPATYSALAAIFSATAAWLTYENNFRPHNLVALVSTGQNIWGITKGPQLFSYSVLDQGNEGLLINDVHLLFISGESLEADVCSSKDFLISSIIEEKDQRKSNGPIYFSQKDSSEQEVDSIALLAPTQSDPEKRFLNVWVPAHQGITGILTFNMADVFIINGETPRFVL